MNRFELALAIVLSGVFAVFALLRVEALDRDAIRLGVSAFLFAFYCCVVVWGAEGKKRNLPVLHQTILGIATALVMAGVMQASSTGYAAALVLGLVLGFTADRWAKHIQLP